MMENRMYDPILESVRARVGRISALQLGALMIPPGILFLFLGILDAAALCRNAIPIPGGWEAVFLFHLVQAGVLAAALVGFFLAMILQYRSYTRRLGYWIPRVTLPKGRNLFLWSLVWLILIASSLAQNIPGVVFPWFGFTACVFLSLAGLTEPNHLRMYYPAIALPLAALSFLPWAMDLPVEQSAWGRVASYGAYGLALVLAGLVDHIRLSRLVSNPAEVADGKAV